MLKKMCIRDRISFHVASPEPRRVVVGMSMQQIQDRQVFRKRLS